MYDTLQPTSSNIYMFPPKSQHLISHFSEIPGVWNEEVLASKTLTLRPWNSAAFRKDSFVRVESSMKMVYTAACALTKNHMDPYGPLRATYYAPRFFGCITWWLIQVSLVGKFRGVWKLQSVHYGQKQHWTKQKTSSRYNNLWYKRPSTAVLLNKLINLKSATWSCQSTSQSLPQGTSNAIGLRH